MNRKPLIAIALGLALAFSASAAEKNIGLKDAPAAVQKAVTAELKGGTLKSLSVETEDGKTEYEAEITLAGHNRSVVVDPSGKVLESEGPVELSALPEAARASLTREAGKGTIAKVEESTKGGVTSYEALIKEKGKKDREVEVGPDGKLIPEKK